MGGPAMGSRRGRRDMDMMEEARGMPTPRKIPARQPQEEMPGFSPRRRSQTPKKGPDMAVMGGGYKKGGKVRGCGMARGGRPCKMVKMKGS